jgi:outer membrane biogenesis lipoprotein LolB
LRALLCLAVAMLSSCASVPEPQQPVIDSASRSAQMATHQNWRFEGRVAYSHQGKGGSAQIVWLQKAEVSDIKISAPLTVGSARIVLTPDSAQFIDSKGKVVAEGDPDAVFLQVLQTPVPKRWFANGLRAFWPDNPELTGSALAGQVLIDQWQWRYLEWQNSPIFLPKQIEIKHDETRVRILIDSWQELPDG